MNIHEKIAALIAKAQSTPFQHEADAFMEKAQSLMVKHAISEASLHGTGETKEDITDLWFELDNQVGWRFRANLAIRIARVFGGYGFYDRSHNRNGFTLVGYPSDLLNAFTLWASLCVQLDRFYLAARENGDHIVNGVKSHHREFKAQFVYGFCLEAGNRVASRYAKAVEAEATESQALVLRDRSREVRDFANAKFHLTKSPARYVGNGAGQASGRNAGQRANISNGSGSIGQSTRLLGKG